MQQRQSSTSPPPSVSAAAVRRIEPRRAVLFTVAVLAGVALALIPAPQGIPQQAMVALGATAATVMLWATLAIPQPMVAALFLASVIVTGTASPSAALSGFQSSSLWLVFGGLLIGTAAERTGFGRWVARRFLGRFRDTYSGLVLGIIFGTTVLSFLVPANMGRIAITVPVVMALAKDAGYDPGSPGYIGLVVTAVIGNFTVALAILPANLLNIMIVGTGETLYGVRISYMQYLVMCAPVLGLLKAAIVWGSVLWLFPAPRPTQDADDSRKDVLGREAKRVALILGGAILAWATDSIHGLRPGWIALIAGLACLMPGIGVLPASEAADRRKLLILLWVGTVVGIGGVLTESGASRLVSSALASVSGANGQSPTYGYFALAYLASILGVLATIGGAIPIVATAIAEIGAGTGLPTPTGIMAIAAGMSALFFPYEAAPVMVGLMLGKVSVAAATRFTLLTSALTWLLVIPLNALWWRAIGAIP